MFCEWCFCFISYAGSIVSLVYFLNMWQGQLHHSVLDIVVPNKFIFVLVTGWYRVCVTFHITGLNRIQTRC